MLAEALTYCDWAQNKELILARGIYRGARKTAPGELYDHWRETFLRSCFSSFIKTSMLVQFARFFATAKRLTPVSELHVAYVTTHFDLPSSPHFVADFLQAKCDFTRKTTVLQLWATLWREARRGVGSPRSQSRKEMWLTGEKYDWLTTCHNMTGGGGVMTTSASTGVVYSAPQAPIAGFEGMWSGKGKERRGKKTKGGKGRGGRGKGKGMEEKGRWNGRGSEGRDGTPLFGTKWRQCQPVIYIREE